jgi:hypothetical protein
MPPQPQPPRRLPIQDTSYVKSDYRSTAGQGQPPPLTKDTNISININLPKIHRPHLPKLPYKRISAVIIIALLCIAGGWLGYHYINQARLNHRIEEAAHAAADADIPKLTKPNFTPLVPSNQPNFSSVGQEAAFDATKDVYSYQDSLDGTQFTLSQQPVPANFSSAKDAVQSVAKSLSASTALITKTGTAYLATDSQSNSQIIVYTVDDLLIFIQSPFTHPGSDWVNFLNTLK